ncbi:Family 31 carbohydrate-binding protein [Balamuthia mandrillaris]
MVRQSPLPLLLSLLVAAALVLLPGIRAREVTTNGNKLLVDGKPFLVKGINYHPVPVGEGPGDWFDAANEPIWSRDIPNMVALGVNTVRIYDWWDPGDHSAFMDALDEAGITCLFVSYLPWLDGPSDLFGTLNEGHKDNVKEMVQGVADHPVLCGWIVGNEQNNEEDEFENLLNNVNELAKTIHDEETRLGYSTHPVTTTFLQTAELVSQLSQLDDMSDIGFLSPQLYLAEYGELFAEMAAVTDKPIVITEFGLDSWHYGNQAEDQQMQADHVQRNLEEMYSEDNLAYVSGGIIFAYSDEWWKCGNNDVHDTCDWGSDNPNFEDLRGNEEWFGVFSISDGGATPNELSAKLVAQVIADHFEGTSDFPGGDGSNNDGGDGSGDGDGTDGGDGSGDGGDGGNASQLAPFYSYRMYL